MAPTLTIVYGNAPTAATSVPSCAATAVSLSSVPGGWLSAGAVSLPASPSPISGSSLRHCGYLPSIVGVCKNSGAPPSNVT